jgi:hypothetical protein
MWRTSRWYGVSRGSRKGEEEKRRRGEEEKRRKGDNRHLAFSSSPLLLFSFSGSLPACQWP